MISPDTTVVKVMNKMGKGKNMSPSVQDLQTSEHVQTFNIIMKQLCPGIDHIFMFMPWGSKNDMFIIIQIFS